MNIKKIILSLLCFLTAGTGAEAADIVFIPHDNRPICLERTAEVAEAAGIGLIIPPKGLLAEKVEVPGDAEGLWAWLEAEAPRAKAAVISADSMLYGGLMASRRHELDEKTIQDRVDRFRKLKEKYPTLRLYLFGSLMRTPKSGAYAGREEPDYYMEHGENIFRYTAKLDQAQQRGNSVDKKELKELRDKIPPEVLEDWLGRRQKNLKATKTLMYLTAKGGVDYFVLGRDDNAPYCQTQIENREIKDYAERMGLNRESFQSLTGIDEFNLLLLARAVNDAKREIPFVCTEYNIGLGEKTIPAFADESIGQALKDAITVAGGMSVKRPEKADFLLLVNTNPDGNTGEAGYRKAGSAPIVNDGQSRYGSKEFADLVEKRLAAGYPVGIADIAFANGADNALMGDLKKRGLLGKLRSYAGWNTATNSAGFALAMGMLSAKMKDSDRKKLLAARYLDDWAYQANVRQDMSDWLGQQGHWQSYVKMEKEMEQICRDRSTNLIKEFAQKNLPPLADYSRLRVSFPWERMFECDISF